MVWHDILIQHNHRAACADILCPATAGLSIRSVFTGAKIRCLSDDRNLMNSLFLCPIAKHFLTLKNKKMKKLTATETQTVNGGGIKLN
jgi:hypothetical protein